MNVASAWDEVQELYRRPLVASITLHATLSDAQYERWRQDARRLMKLIDLDLPFWQKLAAESARLSFFLHNSPMGPKGALPQQMLGSSLMESSYRQSSSTAVKDALESFWASRNSLKSYTGSPFLAWLTDVYQREYRSGRSALILPKKAWIQPTKALTRSIPALRRIEVIDLSYLSSPRTYDRIFVCGALSLYSSALYACARAQEIEWALYSWMKSELPPMDQGLIEAPRALLEARVIGPNPKEHEHVRETENVDATGIWNISNAGACLADLAGGADVLDAVPAVELLLVDGSRTFAPLEEKISVATAADSWTPGTIWLNRKFGKDLSPDDFIIVRTYGDGDVIQQLANQLLGARASELRKSQALWKFKLADLRRTMSMDTLVGTLRRAGSLIADHQNVRNWMSPRHIRTQNKEDFTAILRITGLEALEPTLWLQMGDIVRAHVRAGMVLKNRLTSTLKKYSGSELLAAGRLEVAHSSGDSGCLVAIQIRSIGKQSEVREASLLRLIEPWHG